MITSRPHGPKTVDLEAPSATADSSAGRHAAIDKVAVSEGIVFVVGGGYTVTRTIYVWPGVRLIGCGDMLPLFVRHPTLQAFILEWEHGDVYRPHTQRAPRLLRVQ
jgi:hypothetical protein